MEETKISEKGYKKKLKVSLGKVRKKLRKPLIKGSKKTSLGGGRVRVSSSAGIKGFFK